jgi:hypothetical protein
LRLKTLVAGKAAPGQPVQWSADTRGEAKKVEPQMNAKNANGSAPKRFSRQIFAFTLAGWCVAWKRCVEVRYDAPSI